MPAPPPDDDGTAVVVVVAVVLAAGDAAAAATVTTLLDRRPPAVDSTAATVPFVLVFVIGVGVGVFVDVLAVKSLANLTKFSFTTSRYINFSSQLKTVSTANLFTSTLRYSPVDPTGASIIRPPRSSFCAFNFNNRCDLLLCDFSAKSKTEMLLQLS